MAIGCQGDVKEVSRFGLLPRLFMTKEKQNDSGEIIADMLTSSCEDFFLLPKGWIPKNYSGIPRSIVVTV